MEQIGFGGRRARILRQEHLQRWGRTDTEVEGPSEVGYHGYSGRRARILWQEHPKRWGRTDAEVERPSEAEPLDCIGRSTADVRGATYKTLIIKDLLDFRVVIFTTLKSVKSLSIRQLRDAPGVYGNKKPLNSFALTSEGLAGIIRCRAGVGKQGRPSGDGKPVGPDRPLEKGVGRI